MVTTSVRSFPDACQEHEDGAKEEERKKKGKGKETKKEKTKKLQNCPREPTRPLHTLQPSVLVHALRPSIMILAIPLPRHRQEAPRNR